MVSAYEMFAACVDLVVGTIKWVTWPFVVVSWPFRKAIQFIFSWWSYLIKTLVYSVLDTVLWPFQVVAAARREKETRNQLLIAQHQLFQATAVAKDLTMKYEIALEERTHARDALETCVEEKKRLKNRFQQAQAMLRKMDAERRHAWEMAEAQAKGGAEDDTIEGEPTSKEHIALDNVNTDRHPPPSPQVRPSVRMSDVSEHQQLFLNAELANGKSEISNHDLEDMLSPNQRSKRARRESNEGPLRSPDNSDRQESLGAAARRESLETESRRDSFGTGRRRDSNASAGTHLTLDEEADDGEDGSSGLVSTVVSCGLVGWTLVVLGASTAAIVCLFVIMILPSLIGPGKDSTTRRISEYVGCAKWFVLGFVFCFYMETEEFSWFKQGLEAIPDRDTLMAITQPASGRK